MNNDLYLLPDDRDYAEQRIIQLEKDIQDLGADFNDAFSQSSETWHDNSPFEAVRDKQSMMAAELNTLRTLIRTASLKPPKKKRGTAGVGSSVELDNGSKYAIAGSWTYKAGSKHNGVVWVSSGTPVAASLLGKKVGDTVSFAKVCATIASIEN